MKKTAVTQLIEQLTAVGALEIPEGTNAITMIIADAKEMERERLEEAYQMGREGLTITEFNETFNP